MVLREKVPNRFLWTCLKGEEMGFTTSNPLSGWVGKTASSMRHLPRIIIWPPIIWPPIVTTWQARGRLEDPKKLNITDRLRLKLGCITPKMWSSLKGKVWALSFWLCGQIRCTVSSIMGLFKTKWLTSVTYVSILEDVLTFNNHIFLLVSLQTHVLLHAQSPFAFIWCWFIM